MTNPKRSDIEPDPRTDGVGDGGMNELDPPTDEEIEAGLELDQQVQQDAAAGLINDPDGEHVGHDHVAHDDDPNR